MTATWFKYCGNIGFTGPMSWSPTARATSHIVEAIWTTVAGVSSGWTTVTTTGSNSLTINQFGSVADVPNVSARARKRRRGFLRKYSNGRPNFPRPYIEIGPRELDSCGLIASLLLIELDHDVGRRPVPNPGVCRSDRSRFRSRSLE